MQLNLLTELLERSTSPYDGLEFTLLFFKIGYMVITGQVKQLHIYVCMPTYDTSIECAAMPQYMPIDSCFLTQNVSLFMKAVLVIQTEAICNVSSLHLQDVDFFFKSQFITKYVETNLNEIKLMQLRLKPNPYFNLPKNTMQIKRWC